MVEHLSGDDLWTPPRKVNGFSAELPLNAPSRESVSSSAAALSEPSAHGWPRHWHYALAGGFFLALAVYGSIVPLEYRPLDWSTAVERFTRLFSQGITRLSKTDVAVNVLLFVPVSFCFLASLTSESSRGFSLILKAVLVLVGCTVASMMIEFSQMWFVRRTASPYDVYAQIVGSLIGLSTWIGGGRALSDWLRKRSAVHARLVSLAGLLSVYCGGLMLYWMLPLDLTIRPVELWRKYKNGLLMLRPFAEVDSIASLVEVISHVAAFVPVGMLAVVLFTSSRRPLRSWIGSLVVAFILVSMVWGGGLLAVSHFSSSTQLLAGMTGAIGGIWLAKTWLANWAQPETEFQASIDEKEVAPQQDRFWLFVIGTILYSCLLVLLFCYPEGKDWEPVTHPDKLQDGFQSMFRPPLSSLYKGSIFNAVKEFVRKVGFFFLWGLLLAGVIGSLKVPDSARRMLAVGACLAGFLLGVGMEMLQIVIPGHTPDLTDAGLCALGAGLGIWIGLLWKKKTA